MAKNGKHHPLLMLYVRRKAIVAVHKEQGFSMADARQMVSELGDKEIEGAVNRVAAAKGLQVPAAVGADGDHPFIDFLNAHWADILAIILKLLGL